MKLPVRTRCVAMTAAALALLQPAVASGAQCDALLNASNEAIRSQFEGWQSKVEALEQMSTDELVREADARGGADRMLGGVFAAGGSRDDDAARGRGLRLGLARAYMDEARRQIAKTQKIDEPTHLALEAWERCAGQVLADEDLGLTGRLISINGGVITVEFAHYGADDRARRVRVTDVRFKNLVKPNGLEAFKGEELGAAGRRFSLLRERRGPASITVATDAGQSVEVRIPHTGRPGSWRDQAAAAFEHGAAAVASQGAFNDRIVVRWRPVDDRNVIRYCISGSSSPDHDPTDPAGQYFWVRSDDPAVNRSFPGNSEFVWYIGDTIKPGRVYYVRIQYDVKVPGSRVGDPGNAGVPGVERRLLTTTPIPGTIR